jgi:hypothetical protein
VLAVALLKQGVDVKVFERDLTAIRGEGKYRGPIQVCSKSRSSTFAVSGRAVGSLRIRTRLHWPISAAGPVLFAVQATAAAWRWACRR